MLVVASDIHLLDETVGVVVSDKTFSLFANRLRELAYRASWRARDRYEPVSAVNILLLGDILDPLQSTHWLEREPGQDGYVRPWHDPHSPLFIQKVVDITRAILDKNRNALGVLKKYRAARASNCRPLTGAAGRTSTAVSALSRRCAFITWSAITTGSITCTAQRMTPFAQKWLTQWD